MKSSHLILLLILALLAIAPMCARADWPTFRGTPSLDGHAAETLPGPVHVLWSRDVGSIEATAAIVDGTVYVATMRGTVTALSLATGKPRWTYKSVDAFSASPCVVHGIVTVGDEGGVLHALRASDGKLLWKRPTGDKISSSATPAPGGRLLFGSYDGHLYCVYERTGAVRWSLKTEAQVHATPCLVGNTAIVAGCDGKVRGIDMRNGSQRYVVAAGASMGASPAGSARAIYLGTLGGTFFALDPVRGRSIWRLQEHEDGASLYASPALSGDNVIYASRSQRIYCLDGRNGHARWAVSTSSQVNSSPVIAGGTVWLGTDEGTLLALDIRSGATQWRFRAGGELKASPAIASGRLVIGSTSGTLFCLGR